MSLATFMEVAGGIVFLGLLIWMIIAPAKVGKPYIEGTEVIRPESKADGDLS